LAATLRRDGFRHRGFWIRCAANGQRNQACGYGGPRVDFVAYPRGSTFVLSVSPQLGESIEETREDDAFSQYTEEITGLSFQNVPVRSALYQLASFYDFNLVASDSISGEITIDLDGVPWDQALALVLRLKRLSGRLEGNVLYVAPTEELAAQDQFDIEAAEQAEALAPLATEFLQVNYANADELLLLLVGVGANGQQNLSQVQAGGDRRLNQGLLSPRGSASVDPRTNILIVRDIREKLDEVKALLATLDIAVRQVLIEARIVNVETSIGRELGIRWGFGGRVDNTRIGGSQGTTTSLLNSEAARADARAESFIAGEAARINALLDETPAELIDDLVALAQASVPIPRDVIAFPEALSVDLGVADPEASSFALGYARDSGLIELELSALESSGNGEVIARPKVTTQDKMPALIQSGVRIPYQAQAGGTGGRLDHSVRGSRIVPRSYSSDYADGRINMQLDIRQDSVAPGNSLIPAINTNQVNTRALVNDGETIVLGGVFREETSVTESKTPILGDLPYVGRLFKRSNRSNRRTELLIFITPKILDELPR
jgi:type IV pilus assembly protein PilQ